MVVASLPAAAVGARGQPRQRRRRRRRRRPAEADS